MSLCLCINPNCQKRQNPDNEVFCRDCGSQLLIQGRYRVIAELGKGGFGQTYEINEVRTNQPKVLKVLINYDPKAIALFKQEAEVLSQLHHPGIPQVEADAYFLYYPYNSQTAIHCFVMEKIEGTDLEEYMIKRGLLPIDQTLAIQWLKDLLNILKEIHDQDFFHRDIKPPNIMLRAKTAQLTLIDFGTIRKVTRTVVNQQGGVTKIISAGFTPWEQINSNALPQSDFFALGRTFVYLLTGKQPLDPAIYDTYNDEFKWRSHATQISPMLADLLDDMMQRLYKDRPQTAEEILRRIADIEKALQPPKPQPPQPPQPPQNQSSQNQSLQNSGSSGNITRRNFLVYPSLFVGGVTIAVVGQNYLFPSRKNQTSEITTSSNTPTPKNQTPKNQTSENPTSSNSLSTFNFEVVKTDSTGSIISKNNSSARYFTEDLGNSVTLEMVEIPGGSFMMGSPESEAQRNSDESPQHQVTVPSFFMGKYQLTQKQYEAIIGVNPSNFKGENRPVEKVSWDDAVKFCQRLSQKTGKNYTLPSEAQWEYACRAGTTTPFYFGESITPDLVNYDGNYPYASAPKGQYRQQTTDVGSFPPNAFGLYDMHGNVWEWCLDDYEDNYNNAPTDSSALINRSADPKLLRGGFWNHDARHCRSAHRYRSAQSARYFYYGFRVVVVVA
jgi:formylglycine-generating enzyme required for sulfatase activity